MFYLSAASINITWSDAEYPLVGGATNLNCITPFPDGLTITSSGVLSTNNVQPSFSGEYQCQLSPPYGGDIIVNVRIVGKSSVCVCVCACVGVVDDRRVWSLCIRLLNMSVLVQRRFDIINLWQLHVVSR